jgi:hypothetical protein
MKKLGQCLAASLLAAGSLVLLGPHSTAHASTLNACVCVQPGDEGAEPAAANFEGKIVSLNGRLFILRDYAHDTWYHLDDQKVAAQFVGKQVTVTGVLDTRSDVIRVRAIRESA